MGLLERSFWIGDREEIYATLKWRDETRRSGLFPFALDWIDPTHFAWNERGAQQSIVKMHRLYKAWFDTWYDGCLGESCVVKPSPASIATCKSYVSQLPTCFAMTSDKAEVTIAAAQMCVDALVKRKARG